LKEKSGMRRWVMVAVLLCFLIPAAGLFLAARFHPATVSNISLSAAKVPFLTGARRILSPEDNQQVNVTGLDSLQMDLSPGAVVTVDGRTLKSGRLEVHGEPGASCSFYLVRTSSFELTGPTKISLEVPNAEDAPGAWFTLKAHGVLQGTLTSRTRNGRSRSGFMCRRVQVNGMTAELLETDLAAEGSDVLFLTTAGDARLDFELSPHSQIGDSQIAIMDEVRFADIDPQTGEEKTVLRKPPSGYKNEISFDNLEKTVSLNDADLLVVEPASEFYLRQFTVKDGIQLSMHGLVRDVRVGPGSGAMESRMPSLFDHLDTEKRFWLAVPAIAGVLLGILEKMGLLKKNESAA